jgi:hypothetical protein
MIYTDYDPFGALYGDPLLRDAKRLIFIDIILLFFPIALGMFAGVQMGGIIENLQNGTNEIQKKYNYNGAIKAKKRANAEVFTIIFGPKPSLAYILLPY